MKNLPWRAGGSAGWRWVVCLFWPFRPRHPNTLSTAFLERFLASPLPLIRNFDFSPPPSYTSLPACPPRTFFFRKSLRAPSGFHSRPRRSSAASSYIGPFFLEENFGKLGRLEVGRFLAKVPDKRLAYNAANRQWLLNDSTPSTGRPHTSWLYIEGGCFCCDWIRTVNWYS